MERNELRNKPKYTNQLVFSKRAKLNRSQSIFTINGADKTRYPHTQTFSFTKHYIQKLN